MNLLFAASTQRTIGWVIAVVAIAAFVIYLLVNTFRSGKREIGSEVELAPNRKPYYDDEMLETKKLDMTLAAGLGGLALIAVALPLYWLGEPGRQEGFVEYKDNQFVKRGGVLYQELCAACHGVDGGGGVAGFTVADDSGRFIAATSWQAPALNNLFARYDDEVVTDILNYGRPHSPMPAFGAAGGGPLTSQQIEDELIGYLRTIQLDFTTMAEQVDTGLLAAARAKVLELDPDLAAELRQVQAVQADDEASEQDQAAASARFAELNDELAVMAAAYLEEASEEELGELLFANPIAAGSYNCARCHTAGWSWGADDLLAAAPDAYDGLIAPEVPGGGGFGPSLVGGASQRQFDTAEEQEAFIAAGCEQGLRYGNNGFCDGGQMPGFAGMLSEEQIAAIVAYVRGL